MKTTECQTREGKTREGNTREGDTREDKGREDNEMENDRWEHKGARDTSREDEGWDGKRREANFQYQMQDLMEPLDHVPTKTVDANFEYPHPLLWRPVTPELETEFGKLDGIKSAT
jgi:hypothetical protein